MLPIQIDISDLGEELDLMQDQIDKMSGVVLDKIVAVYVQGWQKLVGDTLRKTRNEYFKAMYTEKIDSRTVVVGLNDRYSGIPLNIEEGSAPRDMKDGFERSNKRVQKLSVDKKGRLIRDKDGKTVAGGWYLTIPFRLATPDALGEASIFVKRMPTEVHDIAKTVGKISIADLPAHLAEPRERKAINTVSGYFPAYKHKNPIFEGLQKGNKLYNSQYTTFRRVSDKSDADSWIHPGFAAYDLMGKALITLEDQLEATIDATAKEFILG